MKIILACLFVIAGSFVAAADPNSIASPAEQEAERNYLNDRHELHSDYRQLHTDERLGNRDAIRSDKNELREDRNDLNKDKQALRREQQKTLHTDSQNLQNAYRQLHTDERSGNTAAIAHDEQVINENRNTLFHEENNMQHLTRRERWHNNH